MDKTEKTIIVEQPGNIGERVAADIVAMFKEFYADPENLARFEKWKAEQESKKQSKTTA